MMPSIFHPAKCHVGIFTVPQGFELVFFDQQQQPHFCHIEQAAQVPIFLRQQLAGNISKKTRFFYISCLTPRLLWQKHLLLPQVKQAADRYRQVQLILRQQLPIDESQLQFDFHSTPLSQNNSAQQLDYVQIYAAKKHNIQHYCQQFQPLRLTALDFYAHALLRAFLYCSQIIADEHTLFLYQHDQHSALLQQCHNELIQNYHTDTLSALVSQFSQQYPTAEITRYVIYATPENILALHHLRTPKTEFMTIDPQQYPAFIALGCALWSPQHSSHTPSIALGKHV